MNKPSCKTGILFGFKKDCHAESSVRNLHKNKKGFGHFVAIGMGVAASLVLFGVVWPSAKAMMGNTVSSMNLLNTQMVGSMGGLQISGAIGSGSVTITPTAQPAPQFGSNAVGTVTATLDGANDPISSGNLISTIASSYPITISNTPKAGDTLVITITMTNGAVYSGTQSF